LFHSCWKQKNLILHPVFFLFLVGILIQQGSLSHAQIIYNEEEQELIQRWSNPAVSNPAEDPNVKIIEAPVEKGMTPRSSIVLPGLINPGFDDLNGDGEPDGFNKIGSPVLIEDSGNTFIRTSGGQLYESEFLRTNPEQHISFTLNVRADLGFEPVALLSFQNIINGGADYFQRSRVSLNTQNWRTVFFSLDLLESETNRIRLRPTSSESLSWFDIDDLDAVDTNVFDGDFEGDGDPFAPSDFPARRWDISNGSIQTSNAFDDSTSNVLHLEPNGSANQIVAGLRGTHHYFLQLKARSDLPSDIIIYEEFLTSLGDVITSKTYEAIQTNTDVTKFTQTIQSERKLSIQASRLVIENVGNEPVEIDQVSRGYVMLSPTPFNPSDQVLDEELEGLIAWPRKTFNLDAEFVDPTATTQFQTSNTQIQSATRFQWNPPESIPVGDWSLDLELLDQQSSETLELSLPFEVSEPLDLQFPEQITSNKLEFGAWTWLIGLPIEEPILRSFLQQIKDDNYSFAIVFAESDKWSLVAEICDDIELPFIAADFMIQNEAKSTPASNETISAETYQQLIVDTLGDAIEAEQYLGIFVIDEPIGVFDDERTERNSRIIASTPDFKEPFFIVSPLPTNPDLIDRLRPPGYWTVIYPTNRGSENLTDNLKNLSQRMGTDKAVADRNNLPYYHVAQSFTTPDFYILGPREMIEATVGTGVVHAIDGIITFTHFTIGPLEGVRDENLEVKSNAGEWNVQFERLRKLETTLANRALVDPVTDSGLALWSSSLNTSGTKHLNIASLSPRSSIDVRISLSELEGTITNIETSEQFTAQNSIIDLEFQPGEWRVFELNNSDIEIISVSSFPGNPEPSDFELMQTGSLQLNQGIIETDVENDLIYVPTANQMTVLDSDLNQVSMFSNTGVWISVVDEIAYLGDPAFGLNSLNTQTEEFEILTRRRSGSVQNLLVDQDRSWHSLNYLGLSVFDLSEDAEFIDHEFAASIARELESSPLGDGAILADEQSGVWLYGLNQSELQATQLFALRRAIDIELNQSMNRLAVASLREGISIYDVVIDESSTTSTLQLVQDFVSNPEGEKVEHVNWIHDQLLVATEWDGDSLFFLNQEGEFQYIGRNKSPVRDASIADVQIIDDSLFQFYRDGEIRKFDLAPVIDFVIPQADYSNWLIF